MQFYEVKSHGITIEISPYYLTAFEAYSQSTVKEKQIFVISETGMKKELIPAVTEQ